MKIAIIGQSLFASSVYKLLKSEGHTVVGVFTIPDVNSREDPLASAASADDVPVFKLSRWRVKGETIPEVLTKYQSVGAELNVLPYCSQFIPMEVINYPKYQSICYHPSLLPRHRGAAAINWTLIHGDKKGGFSIFWPDKGLDTGPVLLMKEITLDPNETVESLYNRFLFPEGIKAHGEAVALIAGGRAPRIVQTEEGATYEPMLNKPEASFVNFAALKGHELHNFIRGCDRVPGAWATFEDNSAVKLFEATLFTAKIPKGVEVQVKGMDKPGIVHNGGLLLLGTDGVAVNVAKLGLENGKMIPAAKYGQGDMSSDIGEYSAEEKELVKQIEAIWTAILRIEIADSTDFFKAGAASMDVTRMVEEIKHIGGPAVENGDVYMATTFDEFSKMIILISRGGSSKPKLEFDKITLEVNKRTIYFPNQLFINNQFVNSSNPDKKLKSINPTDESLICEVESATAEDVDTAVHAALEAFENGEWTRMNARDRGKLMYRLADLMEEYKEELATIESIDSGAVYTLAIKTHIGMSIETFRYFAGWCDKILGSTIPINNSRPNKNLSFTRKEPIGVCGIITPWNYPLMMVAWKMAACLAAGNTVVLKPAQVSPLTALKLAELSYLAGFPPGVINVLPGSGAVCGQAMAEHPLIRKLGFTGSTPIGQVIMSTCAKSNVKRVSLELGGKSPLIIFADADMDRAVRQSLSAVFFNKGENCIAAGRIFVEESVHDEFVTRVIEETKKIVIGDPLDRSTSHGPQNHRAHLEKLIKYCEIGRSEGAKCVLGGSQVKRPGLFFEPTIFTQVDDEMYIAKEESFGPIMIISSFSNGDLDGVVRRANGTEFGLASGVFTKDIGKAMQVSERINAGTCFVNCYNKTDVAAPFGGFKQSGFGKDLGAEALNEYLRVKCVTIEY